MKSKYVLLLILLLCCYMVNYAQQSYAGIYSTYSDFITNKISISANPKFGKKAVQISDFFLRPYIYLKTDSDKNKISMDSVFAVQCYDGSIYRIWKQKAYVLVDTSFLKIYNYSRFETVKCKYSRGYRLKNEWVTHYYFSKDYNSPLYPLSLINVRLALKQDDSFDVKLLQVFPNDISLQKEKNNQFEINQFILNNSILYEK